MKTYILMITEGYGDVSAYQIQAPSLVKAVCAFEWEMGGKEDEESRKKFDKEIKERLEQHEVDLDGDGFECEWGGQCMMVYELKEMDKISY